MFLNHLSNNDIHSMDDGEAKDIIETSILPTIIASDLLKSSPVSYFYTKNSHMRMYVTNINDITKINNCVQVVKYDIWCNNGIIHIVSGLIQPSLDHFLN
jgi:hypothetical protein